MTGGVPFIVNALDRQGGGPDDNSAQAGHLVVAAPLTKGSSTPGVSAPGRRQEDDVNIVPVLSATLKGQRGKGGGGIGPEETLLPSSSAVRRLTPTECERLMSWPDGWTAVDGPDTPDSRRYAACGDGVVSNAAEWIARGIMQED